MATDKGDYALKLERNIACIKYTLFCFNIVNWILGISLFGLVIWIVSEPNYAEWLTLLDAQIYYVGLYILILASIITMIVSFVGCGSALMEHHLGLMVFLGTQVFGFVAHVVGSAVLLDFSTLNSSLQPILKRSLTWLISRSAFPTEANVLRLIQESLGCCGADGSNDYMTLRQPLPSSCRDSVTGNAFYNGCAEELTWFLEDKSVWVAGLAVGISAVCVANGVLSLVLVQALKKEEQEARSYRR